MVCRTEKEAGVLTPELDKALEENYAGSEKRRIQEIASLLHCHPWEIIPTIQHLKRERDEALWAAEKVKV